MTIGEKANYITSLSVFSAFAVISLHTNGVFWDFSTRHYWLTANIIECFYYFAVPVFFMVSGATLIDFRDRYNLKSYFYKRFHKTVVPFIFWSFMGLVFHVFFLKDIPISNLNAFYIWNGVLGTSFVGVFWFFIPLFISYLSIPLFSEVHKQRRIKVFSYLIAVAFFLNFLIPFLIKISNLAIKWPIHIPAVEGNLIFILLGYVLSKVVISKSVRYSIYVFAIIGLLMHILGTYSLSMEAGKIIRTFKGFTNIPSILYAMGVFVFFKENEETIIKIGGGRALRILKNYTFPTYLLHWFIMKFVVIEFQVNTYSIFYRLLAPFFIGAVCIIITKIIRCSPIGRIILP